MKVIDLLNKIANGKDTPNVIKFEDKIFTHNGTGINSNYYCEETRKLLEESFVLEDLNKKVEIIEDIPKEDKKIEDKARFQYSQIPSWFDRKELIKAVNENFERHQKALNEIIDKVNGEK